MFRRSNKFKRHRYTLGLMLLACFVIVLFSIIPSSNVEEDFDGEGYEDGEEPDTMFENVDDEPDVVTAEHAQPVSKEGILELQSQISHLKDEIKELTERVGKSELDLVRAEEARLSTPQTSAPTTAPTQQTSSYSSTTQSGYSSSTSGYSSTTGGYSSSSQGSSGLSSGLSSGASSGQCPLGQQFSDQCSACMNPTKRHFSRLHFVHVPKAAGTSFTIPLRRFLDCTPPGKGCWGEPSIVVEGNIECDKRLFGCYGIYPLTQKHSIAMFRDPLTRIVSAYHDGPNFPGGNAEQKASVKGLSFIDYLKFPGVANCQTKMMLGQSCMAPINLSPSDIETAKSKLAELEFFGLQENYQASVCLFYKMLGGMPHPEDFQRLKKTSYDPNFLSEDLIAQVRAVEYADIALYEEALKIFSRKLQDYGMRKDF